MVHCWKCGAELGLGARFCGACGANTEDAPYGRPRPEGEVFRSMRYFVGQTRVNAALSAAFGGAMLLALSTIVPSWAGGVGALVALMGVGSIALGVAHWLPSQG